MLKFLTGLFLGISIAAAGAAADPQAIIQGYGDLESVIEIYDVDGKSHVCESPWVDRQSPTIACYTDWRITDAQ